MRDFVRLRALADCRRRHLPFIETLEDMDIACEIGHHQMAGSPVTLKRLVFTGISSQATVQRRLRRLKRLGIVRERRSETDGRALELTLTSSALRAFSRYDALLTSVPSSALSRSAPR
jgi:DNA-binding MarR family transcriptional regulator